MSRTKLVAAGAVDPAFTASFKVVPRGRNNRRSRPAPGGPRLGADDGSPAEPCVGWDGAMWQAKGVRGRHSGPPWA